MPFSFFKFCNSILMRHERLDKAVHSVRLWFAYGISREYYIMKYRRVWDGTWNMHIVLSWLYLPNLVDLFDLFLHIIQGYFTGTGAIIWLPSASEVTLKIKIWQYTRWFVKVWTINIVEEMIWGRQTYSPMHCILCITNILKSLVPEPRQ